MLAMKDPLEKLVRLAAANNPALEACHEAADIMFEGK